MSNYNSPYFSKYGSSASNYSKPNPPVGAASSASSDHNRPSSLNLSGGPSSSSNLSTIFGKVGPSAISSASSSGPNVGSTGPNKPSRYTPLLPSNISSQQHQPRVSSSTYHTSLGPLGSGGASTGSSSIFNASGLGLGQNKSRPEVVTVPPKTSNTNLLAGYARERDASSSSSSNVPYYQTQMVGYKRGEQQQQPQHPQLGPSSLNLSLSSGPYGHGQLRSGSGIGASPNVSSSSAIAMSKSTQNLMNPIPDVFCLSCPPAEFKFSDAYRAKTLPRTGKENERLIGFATLPEQVHRKSVKKGFDFTLMTVGESGLGKSTLINSLFLADFYQNRKVPSVTDHIKKTTSIQKHTIEIEERGVKLRLTVVDTPGFGDSLNCEDSWKTCTDFIDDQFHQYFQAESGLNRRHIQDTRVHCCLYFIPPYGRGLRPLDIQALKALQNRVNLIPVISKADTLTPTEVKNLKSQVLEDLRSHQVQIYQFPECDEEEDEEFKIQDRELKASIPFAVASSETFVEVGGRKVRGRQYPWGIVEIENPTHSDFGKLRTMLIQSHMHDLKETTQDLHYENFRAKAIQQISGNNISKERSKLKRDSSTSSSGGMGLGIGTGDTQDLLQQKEAEIKRMQQMITKMEAKLKAANKPIIRETSVIDL